MRHPSRLLPLALVALLWFSAEPAVAASSWLTSLPAAKAQARESGKLMLVDLFADWCGWCKELERSVYSTPQFQEYAKKFVLLRVDVEDGGEGTRLQSRFGASSLPTTLILDPHLALVGTVSGFHPTTTYITQIETALAYHQDLVKRFDQALASDDVHQLESVAMEVYGRYDGQRAARAFDRLLVRGPQDPVAQGALRYRRADALRLAEDCEQAGSAVAAGRKEALARADKLLVEHFDFLASQIALDRGDCEKAKRAFESYLVQYPQGQLRRQASAALTELKEHATTCI